MNYKAVFAFYQPMLRGQPDEPMFNIVDPTHERYRSTVSLPKLFEFTFDEIRWMIE